MWNTEVHEIAFACRNGPYVAENEDMVRGESRPLSELLLVVPPVSSAAAAIDISRSSSSTGNINTHIRLMHYTE